ncbi:2,3-diketo-L-gulonate TRAP transporter small permease protein YiaM [Pseudooceanicola marinus]|uniref:TRAP transporter small permease protein n=1 Tax=Pseudooceanicola marinus TaxID=396013 RepID=A0A1X6ZDR2_9RHOB|nr:TRAP transporter small permease [Pseudooceanicola marinus]PJE28338.1 TRAP transporter small permease [Pseudooceanicola marinus]SLN48074.1 2,3-diketo-L-gulonate TRAP transporter small permease protein YiaM [Pseudooceanicola marinus]
MHPQPGESVVDRIEETLIAVILGAMTLITFANVVARYVFNSNILWALEATVFLFGWLVLLGASYAVKKNAHLGVDAVIDIVSAPVRRVLAIIAITICLVFAFLLLKGAWDYWANFANLPQTEGRWFPTGFEESFRPKSWYEVNDIPMPEWLRFLEGAMNEGEEYEKLPRFIPYAILPASMALLLFRFAQVAVGIWKGKFDRIVASHEVEDDIAEVREQRGEF